MVFQSTVSTSYFEIINNAAGPGEVIFSQSLRLAQLFSNTSTCGRSNAWAIRTQNKEEFPKRG